jgi:hypothetical protein
MMTKRGSALALAALLWFPRPAGAHDLARSESALMVAGPREIRATLTLNLLDFPDLAEFDRNRDRVFSYDEIDRGIDRLYAIVREHFEVGAPGPASSVSLERYDMLDATAVRLVLAYRFDADVATVRVRVSLSEVTEPEHVHATSLGTGADRREAVLAGDAREVTFVLPGRWSFDRLLRMAVVVGALLTLVLYALVRRSVLS